MSTEHESEHLMAAVEDAGVTFKRVDTSSTSSFNINGIPLHSSVTFGARYHWALPEPTVLKVVLGKEGLGKQIVKIFKKELQIDDPTFDAAVYIDTEDKEATAAFLGNEMLRTAIFDIVVQGGRVSIEGGEVICELAEDEPIFMGDMARVVMAVLNHG